jgi:hypothetical protein
MNSLQELNKWIEEIKNLEVNDDTIDELNNFNTHFSKIGTQNRT